MAAYIPKALAIKNVREARRRPSEKKGKKYRKRRNPENGGLKAAQSIKCDQT